MTVGVADAADDLMLETLLRKHAAKSSAESLSGACGRSGCSSSFTDCHSLRGFRPQASTAVDQNLTVGAGC